MSTFQHGVVSLFARYSPGSSVAIASKTHAKTDTKSSHQAPDAGESGRRFWQHRLPQVLLGILLVAGLVTIFVRVDHYAITVDEPIRDAYGASIFNWYTTLGHDTSFLTGYNPSNHEPEHGGIFDGVVYAGQLLFSSADHWYVRHVMTALVGWLGLVAIALCGYELGGSWFAFLAALGLWLYPRYYGAIYNNPKDVPATVTMVFLLWGTLILVKQWHTGKHHIRNSILVGCLLGVATAIRGNDVVWFGVLTALLVGWWIFHGSEVWKERRIRAEVAFQGLSAGTIGISFMLATLVLWPYVFLNPLLNLYRALRVLSRYPYQTQVLYNGVAYGSKNLPRDYAPEWLVIGSPLPLILLALLGLGMFIFAAVRSRQIDARQATVVLGFVVPLVAIVVLHAALYNGLRHFLFLIPFLILIAVWGILRTVTALRQRVRHALLAQQRLAIGAALVTFVVLIIGSYGLVVKDMVELSPYEYTYFSPLISGLPGAEGRFDTDYWATCSRESAEWLGQHYREYTNLQSPLLRAPYDAKLTLTFMPSTFRWDKNAHNPDFFIGVAKGNNYRWFPDYKVIKVVAAHGVPLCVVKVNPAVIST